MLHCTGKCDMEVVNVPVLLQLLHEMQTMVRSAAILHALPARHPVSLLTQAIL